MNRDYIMRIIEQFVQALLAIIKARKAKNYEEAFHQIQHASQRYLHTDIVIFLKMSPEHLWEHFKDDSKYSDVEQCIICAELLYETALIFESKQCLDLSIHSKLLSLYLYLNVIPVDKQFQTQSYIDKVNELRIDLESEVIPETVTKSFLTYQRFLNERLCDSVLFKQ
jgi:hypothetical protein